MKKWIAPFFSLFLIFVLTSILASSQNSERLSGKKGEGRIFHTQYRGGGQKNADKDSSTVQLLKELKQKVDDWLKSLNERIEREDVTRFEVRFLEILRSILEWVKEKIDSYLEASEEERPERKEKGTSRDTHQSVSPFFGIG